MALKTYIVTLTPGSNTESAASGLRAKGFAVSNVMKEIGVIAGDADDAAIASLREVPGVADVSESGGVNIPPPDSDVQ